MRLRLLVFLILLNCSVVSGELLIAQNDSTELTAPFFWNLDNTSRNESSDVTMNGYVIAIDPSWHNISALKFWIWTNGSGVGKDITMRFWASGPGDFIPYYLLSNAVISNSDNDEREVTVTFDPVLEIDSNISTYFTFDYIEEDNDLLYDNEFRFNNAGVDSLPEGYMFSSFYIQNMDECSGTTLSWGWGCKPYSDFTFKLFGNVENVTSNYTIPDTNGTGDNLLDQNISGYSPYNGSGDGKYNVLPNNTGFDNILKSEGLCTSGTCKISDGITYIDANILYLWWLGFGAVLFQFYSLGRQE